MGEGLSDSQRRVIASGMLIVDAAAARMLNLLENRSSPVAMPVVEGAIEDGEREQIRAYLHDLQNLITTFVSKYDLHPSKKNIRRILASDISQMWVTLEDSRPSRIRGYGAMPESVAMLVETDLQKMLAVIKRLQAGLK
jgi:hypothetical protein